MPRWSVEFGEIRLQYELTKHSSRGVSYSGRRDHGQSNSSLRLTSQIDNARMEPRNRARSRAYDDCGRDRPRGIDDRNDRDLTRAVWIGQACPKLGPAQGEAGARRESPDGVLGRGRRWARVS